MHVQCMMQQLGMHTWIFAEWTGSNPRLCFKYLVLVFCTWMTILVWHDIWQIFILSVSWHIYTTDPLHGLAIQYIVQCGEGTRWLKASQNDTTRENSVSGQYSLVHTRTAYYACSRTYLLCRVLTCPATVHIRSTCWWSFVYMYIGYLCLLAWCIYHMANETF